MRVWVKEFGEILTIEKADIWTIHGGVKLFKLDRISDVDMNEPIIVTKYDSEIAGLRDKYNILIFEECVQEISLIVTKKVTQNFDYYYLLNGLKHAKAHDVDTVIVGSSYGLFGIDSSMLKKEVNLSLSSQDYYYSVMCARKAIADNPEIKNIVICTGYMFTYFDLSKTHNLNELTRIGDVYNPIFNDSHNCMLIASGNNIVLSSPILNVSWFEDVYAASEYENGYFSEDRCRGKLGAKGWSDLTKEWSDLTPEERKNYGQKRALQHNKFVKNILTYTENRYIINEFSQYCNDKQINLIFMVTPTSQEYDKYLDERYKSAFYEMLNETEGKVHVLDFMNDNIKFENEDFSDADHLGESGSRKVTEVLLDFLNGLRN